MGWNLYSHIEVNNMNKANLEYKTNLQHLIDICIRLSSDKDANILLEDILNVVMTIAKCDAGTIYKIEDGNRLEFSTVINKTLDIYLGGSSGNDIDFPYIDLFSRGIENDSAVVAYAANTGNEINIPDVYDSQPYDMLAAKKMDKLTGYRTQSMLTIPLKDHTDDIIGVIQLINAQDENQQTIPFSDETAVLVRSFVSLGAIAMTNNSLVTEMQQLFLSFAKTIAKAIDMKSSHTGSHCKRVPILTIMLAEAISAANYGVLSDFELTPSDRNQLDIAGWLHDCGKIATPDYIIDKSTKLQSHFDRVHFIETKFEVLKRDIELKYNNQIITALQNKEDIVFSQFEYEKNRELKQVALDLALIRKVNVGGEFLSDEVINNITKIANKYTVKLDNEIQPIINANELENLCIRRGTLTQSEITVMKEHMTVTKSILDSLPFPKHLSNVAEFALGHHERIDGSGYPLGLTVDEMSIHARTMAVADIFEALSASDRPYKRAKPVSECLKIIGELVENNKLDADIFNVFVRERVYENYIYEFGKKEQLDEVDFNNLPGYKHS